MPSYIDSFIENLATETQITDKDLLLVYDAGKIIATAPFQASTARIEELSSRHLSAGYADVREADFEKVTVSDRLRVGNCTFHVLEWGGIVVECRGFDQKLIVRDSVGDTDVLALIREFKELKLGVKIMAWSLLIILIILAFVVYHVCF